VADLAVLSLALLLVDLPWDFLWHPPGDVPAVLPGHLPALSLWDLSWHLPGHHLALGHRDRLARLFGDLLGHFGAGDLGDFGAHLPGDVLGDLPGNVATPLTLNLTTVFNWLIVALLPLDIPACRWSGRHSIKVDGSGVAAESGSRVVGDSAGTASSSSVANLLSHCLALPLVNRCAFLLPNILTLIFVFCLVGGLKLCPASFLILSLALLVKFALPNGPAFVLLNNNAFFIRDRFDFGNDHRVTLRNRESTAMLLNLGLVHCIEDGVGDRSTLLFWHVCARLFGFRSELYLALFLENLLALAVVHSVTLLLLNRLALTFCLGFDYGLALVFLVWGALLVVGRLALLLIHGVALSLSFCHVVSGTLLLLDHVAALNLPGVALSFLDG